MVPVGVAAPEPPATATVTCSAWETEMLLAPGVTVTVGVIGLLPPPPPPPLLPLPPPQAASKTATPEIRHSTGLRAKDPMPSSLPANLRAAGWESRLARGFQGVS